MIIIPYKEGLKAKGHVLKGLGRKLQKREHNKSGKSKGHKGYYNIRFHFVTSLSGRGPFQ